MQLIRNCLFVAIALTVQTGFANKDTLKTYQPDTEDIVILDALDSLTNLLYTTNSFAEIDYEDLPFEEGEVPVYDDEVYQDRLALIPSPINFTYNDAVKKY